MRAVVQRVRRAAVRVVDGADDRTAGGTTVGEIGAGLCVLVGVTHDDDASTARRMAEKIWGLRVFGDESGAMNRSLADAGGAVLVVSQFTLYGDVRRGRRPSFVDAAPGDVAAPLVDAVVGALRDLGATVATGRFGAEMQVELVNDGPVTILVEL